MTIEWPSDRERDHDRVVRFSQIGEDAARMGADVTPRAPPPPSTNVRSSYRPLDTSQLCELVSAGEQIIE